jgi:pimeloyl-ACP methyl ester carboxylesterase
MPTIKMGELTVHYRVKGSGSPLLIFADNLQTAQAYQDEIDHFADRFQVIAFDYPGRGRSNHDLLYPDEQEYDLFGFWADLACHLLQELTLDHPVVLGVGGGAMSALHFAGKQAQQHRLSVRAVIADSFLADWDSRILHRWLDTREHYYVRNQKNMLAQHGEDWRQVVDADTRMLRRLADHGGYQVPDAFLNDIHCPVLLTGHQQDHALPGISAEYARISDLIPNCDIYLSALMNHPYIERPFLWSDPATFRTLADLFLERLVARPCHSD